MSLQWNTMAFSVKLNGKIQSVLVEYITETEPLSTLTCQAWITSPEEEKVRELTEEEYDELSERLENSIKALLE